MKKFIEELKRRNVIKSAVAYLVVAWILQQVFTNLLPLVDAPDWALKGITLLLAIGLPIWIIVSWVYDITPQGIEKTTKESGSELVSQATSKRLNVFIIASLSIAVIVLTLKISNVFTDSDRQYAIAVMPFDNIKVDEENEYLSESFALDVRSYISKVSKFHVTDFYTAKRYKDSDKTNAVIGNELGVSYLLRGTVRQLGNNLSITVELINIKTGEIEWDETYDEIIQNKETLQIQQQVSQKIVQGLRVKLSPQEDKSLKRLATENAEALYWFTKGREFAVQRGGGIAASKSIENLEKSIEYFKKAVALDSTYAEAYAELAHSHYLLPLFREDYIDFEKYDKITVSYLDKASALNPNLFRVYAVKAMMIQNKDWKKGGEYFEKSIALNPNDATVHMQYALHLGWKPKPDLERTLIHIRIAHLLDPITTQKNSQLYNRLLEMGYIEEAEVLLNKYGFVFPKSNLRVKKANLKVYKNKDWTEFIRFYEAEIKKDPSNADLYFRLGNAFNNILNDDINFIKYTKKAYEIDSTNSKYVTTYVGALTEGKQFAAAHNLMQSNNYKSVLSKKQQLSSLFYYYYHQEKYKKAQELLKDSIAWSSGYYTAKLLNHSQLGDRKYAEREFKEYFGEYADWQKAFVYAILKEKDSMYYYMEKPNDIFALRNSINSRREFDPYRKEERYKALLRKTYLPITHWNE